LRRLFGRGQSTDSIGREAAVIAITSGKGGTGKSFVSTNMAVALSRAGRRVALVDCDFGLGNAHLLLGVNPRWTLQHVLDQQMAMDEVVISTSFGPSLVPAGSGISRLADLSDTDMLALATGLASLARRYDVLLLDTAAGISPQCLLTLMLAQHVVLVTNPEIAALTDAYALVKCMARQPARPAISVVINRAPRRGLGEVTFEKLANVSSRFASCEMRYLGEIPDDPAVTQRRLGQPPLVDSHPECEAARCIRGVIRELTAAADGLRPRRVGPRDGLVHRCRVHSATGRSR